MDRRNQRQTEILEVARRLYAERGYDAVSLRDIAAHLKFSKQALYNYFDSKESIFTALQEEGIRKLEEQSQAAELHDPLDNLRQLYLRYYEFSKAHPEYFDLLWVDPSTPAIDSHGPQFRRLADMTEDSRRRIRRCIDEGLFPANLNPTTAAGVLLAAVHGCAVIGLTRRPSVQDLDLLAGILLDAAIGALRVMR